MGRSLVGDADMVRPVRGMARAGTLLRRVAPLALLAWTAACATKKDLKMLTAEMVTMQARQDSLFQILAGQNRAVLDSLHASTELMVRVRGELGHQLIQMDQQLVQIQELTGQSQRRINELRQQIDSRSQTFSSPLPGGGGGGGGAAEADQLYAIGMEKMQQQAAATARMAFQDLMQNHATHEKAPDAQLQIAESFVMERNFDAAMAEFDRVVQLFPNSPRAPTALFRAGMVAKERGNNQQALAYFNRVRSGYPRADEARLATEEIQRLGRRP